jgi:small subunit ribosomal protein S16
VVAEATAPRDGRFVERIGSYNPFLEHGNSNRLVVDTERAKYWLSVGAQPTDRVVSFLASLDLVAKPERNVTPLKSQPKKKAQERLKAAGAAEAEKAAAEAAKAAAEAEKIAAAEAAKAAAAMPKVEEAPAAEPVVEEVAEAPAEATTEQAETTTEETSAV